MICPKCKRECEDNSRYCPYCGAAISEKATLGNKSKKGITLLSIIGLFLCIVAIGICLYLHGQNDQSYIGMEKGTALLAEEAENILLSDISNEDWETFERCNEEIVQIIASYSDDEGYIASHNTQTVLNAVITQVNALYENGTVSYYICESDSVSFEYASGLSAFYSVSKEGNSSSSGDCMQIIAIDSFASGSANPDMTNQAYSGATAILNVFDDAEMNSLKDDQVTVESLMSLPKSSIILWNGHGCFVTHYNKSYPVLLTRERPTGLSAQTKKKLSANYVIANLEYDGDYLAITPIFVEKYLKTNEGLVYLSACESGKNELLTAAFVNAGAQVAFSNTDSVKTVYTQEMMSFIINFMLGSYDNVFHTADEALFLANSYYSSLMPVTISNITYNSLDELIEKGNNGGEVEVRGASSYTIASCIRGEVTFEDNLTQDEIDEILEGLTIRLETEGGQLVGDVSANTDATFYFNNLDSDTTYTATLYQNEKQICQPVSVITVSHRYSSVSVPYSMLVQLDGYVYDQDGMSLEGVSVAAEMDAGNNLWSATTATDSNGYYSLEVYGENTYILTYSKSEYETQENEFSITAAIYEEAQKGNSYQLGDVILVAQGAVESGNVLMSDNSFSTSMHYGETVLGNPYGIHRGNIKTVTFLDTLADMPSDAWDASENQDGSVMAWVTVAEYNENAYSDKNEYNLFIAGEGGVDANPDSSHLFEEYGGFSVSSGELTFNFNSCFYTGNVTNMRYMFYGADAGQIDITSFDTSNVTDMTYMFASCRFVEKIYAGNINVSNVTSMKGMFFGCENLTYLDTTNWDISNVDDMSSMFLNCVSLTDIPFD